MFISVNNFLNKSRKSKIGIALLLLLGIFLGFIVIVGAPFLVVGIIAGKVVPDIIKLPAKFIGALACNGAAQTVGGWLGHLPFVGDTIENTQDDMCAINDLLNATDDAGLNDAVKQAFDCSTFTPADDPQPGENCTDSMGYADEASTAVPKNARWLIPIYQHAAKKYKVPWQLLASVNKTETTYGTNLGTSTAGAQGWMQFMPDTWTSYGVDAGDIPPSRGGGAPCPPPTSKTPSYEKDGKKDTCDPVDAIHGAANYLAASGARGNTTWNYKGCGNDPVSKAVFAYNHACWYVRQIYRDYKAIKAATKPTGDTSTIDVDDGGGGSGNADPGSLTGGALGGTCGSPNQYSPSGPSWSDDKKTVLPDKTRYYVAVTAPENRKGRRDVISADYAVAEFFIKCHPGFKAQEFGYNDIGYGNPRPTCGCHGTHWDGADQDVNVTGVTSFVGPGVYHRAWAKQLAAYYFRAGAVRIFFNDPPVDALFKPKGRVVGVETWPNHENHFHVSWGATAQAAGDPPDAKARGVKVFISGAGPTGDSISVPLDDPGLGFGPGFGF